MSNKEKVEAVINYLCIAATRGSLEDACKWYYEQLGKGNVYKVGRVTLENIYFIQRALNICQTGVYTIENPSSKISHRYFSAAETIRYVMDKCYIKWDGWEGPVETVGDQLLTINRVAYVKEAEPCAY